MIYIGIDVAKHKHDRYKLLRFLLNKILTTLVINPLYRTLYKKSQL